MRYYERRCSKDDAGFPFVVPASAAGPLDTNARGRMNAVLRTASVVSLCRISAWLDGQVTSPADDRRNDVGLDRSRMPICSGRPLHARRML
ncbi:hypothetical protein K227x_40980 [Rubripirellula lacrimiformis]|uniref:Uncharacterized protein n=1 Tax=Rubripirellula lacrimiformis TaxID=1930273 RepID=A0A517NF12_9BACT|nr:hypothetical protein K227x_40980 [Rubripirellula lacrimiformis]